MQLMFPGQKMKGIGRQRFQMVFTELQLRIQPTDNEQLIPEEHVAKLQIRKAGVFGIKFFPNSNKNFMLYQGLLFSNLFLLAVIEQQITTLHLSVLYLS